MHQQTRSAGATVAEMTHVLAENCPEDIAFVGAGREAVTFARLKAETAGLALGLAESGLRPGNRIVAWTDPSFDYLRLLLAAARAGLAVVPVDGQHSAAEVDDLAARLDAQALYAGRRQQAASAVVGRNLPLTIGEEPAPSVRPLRELAVAGAGGISVAAGPEAPLLILPGAGSGSAPRAAVISQRAAKSMCRLNAVAFRLPLRGTLVWPGYPSGLAEFTAVALTHLHVGAGIEITEPAAYAKALASAPPGGLAYAHHGALADGMAEDLRHVSGLGTVYFPAIAADPSPGPVAGATVSRLSAGHDDSVLLRGWNPVEHGLALVAGWRGGVDPPPGDPRFAPIGTLMPDVEARLAGHPGAAGATLMLRSPALMDGYLGFPPVVSAGGYFDTGRTTMVAAGMLFTAITPGVTR